MNNIILVDDDKNFITHFTNEAKTENITVSPKHSLDGLKLLLPSLAHKYAAVVLDIKCLLKDNQAKEDASFIGAAITYLDTNIPGFPRFILTGDETEFEALKRYYRDEKMFIKKPEDQAKLLSELNYCVQNAVPLRIRRENMDVFSAFDNRLLSQSKETTLINIFIHYNETNPLLFRGIIGDIRDMHEEIYKCINKRNQRVVPNTYFNGNGSPTFTANFYRHLTGNPNPTNNHIPTTTVYQDSTINSATKFIHQSCSEYLHGTSKTNYQINTYTIKALINSLMELIIWSKQY